MKDKLVSLIGDKLNYLNVTIDDVFISKEGNVTSLNVVIDSDEIIDIGKVTEATKIINPIVDGAKLADVDVLDIYSKEKGDVE